MLIMLALMLMAMFITWIVLGVEDELFRDEYKPKRYEATSPAMTRWEDGLPSRPNIPWDGFDGASPAYRYQ